MTDQQILVHKSHCCKKHGCKYGDSDCPVELGKIIQDYPCESCSREQEDPLYRKVKKLVKDFSDLKNLTGFMLATMKVNFLRGTITTNPSSSKEELQKLLDSWSETFQKICPPISSKQMAAITADALSDWNENP